MTADLLRRAAVRAQELADGAELAMGEGPWAVRGTGWNDVQGATWTVWRPIQTGVCEAYCEEQAELIAACDPPFLRKVGRLLEACADRVENRPLFAQTPIGAEAAAVARALLGES